MTHSESEHRGIPVKKVAAAMCQRKRGEVLVGAIEEATITELASHGLAQFTIERVASRAGTGKASIYRRWATKELLIADSLIAQAVQFTAVLSDEESTLRSDLLASFNALAHMFNTDFGHAIRTVMGGMFNNTELATLMQDKFIPSRLEQVEPILMRAVHRGEIQPDAIDDLQFRIEVVPAMIIHRFIMLGEAPNEIFIEKIVDDIVLKTFVAAN